jgi:3-deoxy-D-manno-octulosonic-acid transferase
MTAMLYNLVVRLSLTLLRIGALFVPRINEWFAVRKNWQKNLANINPENKPVFWMHVSSLGEFEQGRSVLDRFRQEHPDWFILLTFFSTSGFRVRQHYPAIDHASYLPADTRSNAASFIRLVQPSIAVFVKYDFWYNFLHALKANGTPTLLISALFRPDQPFFKWYGAFWRQMLRCFDQIQVQNQDSATLLAKIGVHHIAICGDTRIDRVLQIAQNESKTLDLVRSLDQSKQCIVAGSIWQPDTNLLEKYADSNHSISWIVAPHEPNDTFLKRLSQGFNVQSIRLSHVLKLEHAEQSSTYQLILVDTIGHLSRLYQYAYIAYIGGGFGKGIHNILEPAAYGIPIIIGPNYAKFNEAQVLVETGGVFAVGDIKELTQTMEYLQNETNYKNASKAVHAFMHANRGGTDKVMLTIHQMIESHDQKFE